MAIVMKNGLMSGRVGNLVYYIVNGKQYVRAYVVPDNPRTPDQKRHRAKVKACGEFLSPFKNVIRIGYQGTKEGLEEYNECAKFHLANAMEETTTPGSYDFTFRVLPEKVRLSRGDIHPPEILSVNRTDNELTLTWNRLLGEYSNRFTDTITAVAYIPGKKVFADFHSGTRADGTGTVSLPPDFAGSFYLWAFFWNGQKSAEPDRRNVSDSVYLGTY